MSNFAALIATIQANIKTNGNEEITGAVLQDVLEAMVQALGTEAINNLETALGDEETARRNADGTLQNNIDAEALRAGTAEAGLAGDIAAEELRAKAAEQTNAGNIATINGKIPSAATTENQLADKDYVTALTTALQTAINTINANIGNGYVYAGIATPSGTPESGKVFYLAVTAGTYTNFGGLVVSQGINILKYNGTAWSQEKLIGIDDVPIADSHELVESNAVNKIQKDISEISILMSASITHDTFLSSGVQIHNGSFRIDWYNVEPLTTYLFSGTKDSNVYGDERYYIDWFDVNNNYISSSIKLVSGDTTVYSDYRVTSPKGAVKAGISMQYAKASYFLLKKVGDIISSYNLDKTIISNKGELLSDMSVIGEKMTPDSVLANSIINSSGKVVSSSYYEVDIYNVNEGDVHWIYYKYSGGAVDIYAVNWYNANGMFIGGSIYKSASEIWLRHEAVIVPKGAVKAYVNRIKSTFSIFYKAELLTHDSILTKETKEASGKTKIGIMVPTSETDNKFINDTFGTTDNGSFCYREYTVVGNNLYAVRYSYNSGTSGIYVVSWLDANSNPVDASILISGTNINKNVSVIKAPKGAVKALVNVVKAYYADFIFGAAIDMTIVEEDEKIKSIKNTIIEGKSLTPSNITDNAFLASGTVINNNSFKIKYYNVTAGKTYLFSGTKLSGTYGDKMYYIDWFDNANNYLTSSIGKLEEGDTTVYKDFPVVAPYGAAKAGVSITKNLENFYFFFKEAVELSKENFMSLASHQNYRMKVVIRRTEWMMQDPAWNEYIEPMVYIRTKYNESKDIIQALWYNANSLISFMAAYVGANTLSDEQLMTSTNRVSYHPDSTSPLRTYPAYWHLFAQHGYPVPVINNVGLTQSDIGAIWKDQINREFSIGKVTDSKIYLLPKIYLSEGHYTRDWHSTGTSDAITSLVHVSGGSYTSTITVSGYSQVQLHPIMKINSRNFEIDGNTISQVGTYYCNEFKINEEQIGYDPATISDWFGGENSSVDVSGADEMVRITASYNFIGVNCCANTTLSLYKEANFQAYGATQQQFFFDNGDYKAMFMIPKAANQNGVQLEKPFNSPSESSPGYTILRNAGDLKDINEPVDRQIGFLYNQNNGQYLVGMAAGLSLVSGCTVKSKRNTSIAENGPLLHFSPSNTNKFYVNAFWDANGGYYQPTLFKEVNYYLSYFDPAENVGQVYWYKDGNKYIIYCHCQSVQNRLAVNVPEFMEGLSLSLVEKTANAELLTDTIQNGKFFVNYNTADANYIVLKTE